MALKKFRSLSVVCDFLPEKSSSGRKLLAFNLSLGFLTVTPVFLSTVSCCLDLSSWPGTLMEFDTVDSSKAMGGLYWCFFRIKVPSSSFPWEKSIKDKKYYRGTMNFTGCTPIS